MFYILEIYGFFRPFKHFLVLKRPKKGESSEMFKNKVTGAFYTLKLV